MLSHLIGKKDSQCIANWSLNLPRLSQTNNSIWTIFNLPSNEKDLIRITSKKIIILNTYGFKISKFISNSTTVLKLLSSPKLFNLNIGSNASERTEGLVWNINTDKLSFKPFT